MNPAQDIHIQFRANPCFLRGIRKLVCSYAEAIGFSPERAREITLAIDEACSNCVKHSYAGHAEGLGQLTLLCDGVTFQAVLRDTGDPVCPKCVVPKSIEPRAVDSLVPGGLGVQFMRQVFDEVEYVPCANGGNCVVMRMNVPQTKEQSKRERE